MPPRFPPVFDDSPVAYAFALFSLSLISAIALAMLIGSMLEERRAREVDRIVHNRVRRAPKRVEMTLLQLHRLIVSGFLLTILFGALPDVIVMLSWGEADDGTMFALFQLDRFFDGLTAFPLVGSFILSTMAAQSVDHRLFTDPAPPPVRLSFRWTSFGDKLKIGGLVLCIAVGVTLYKAGLR
ncbi:hypothetical protein M9978_16360 [Sphingomonas sp. MG17]|uniref:Uncharacterized protein n=1 Tax=Sphingomonas tagetis TaxID=2949092 RepID=A0A9X2HMH0_9SPHN|nr:hypothetical protein [Sphingomonas tagetis]MCP3731999.1 hypothetical protein [Sphingomonas tagetis]